MSSSNDWVAVKQDRFGAVELLSLKYSCIYNEIMKSYYTCILTFVLIFAKLLVISEVYFRFILGWHLVANWKFVSVLSVEIVAILSRFNLVLGKWSKAGIKVWSICALARFENSQFLHTWDMEIEAQVGSVAAADVTVDLLCLFVCWLTFDIIKSSKDVVHVVQL